MHISRIDPANMRGHSGTLIQELDSYWTHSDGVYGREMPLFDKQLWYRAEADGEHLPHMSYLGKDSFIKEVMSGRFGDDYAASITHQDPKFAKTVAAAFPEAASGHPVFDQIQIEVTPPGFFSPLFVDYYRSIRKIQVSTRQNGEPIEMLSVLVVPTDSWRLQFLQSTVSHCDLIQPLHS